MAKDPRPPPTGSSKPNEALDLLRALARARSGAQPPEPAPPTPPAPPSRDEKLDALRELTAKLNLQLRGLPPASHAPGAPPPGPHPPSSSAAPPQPSPDAPPLDEAPEPPAWHARLRQALRREWSALVTALPDAGTLVPRFGRAQIVFIGVSVGVLLIAAIGGIVGMRKPQMASDEVVPPVAPSTPIAPSAPTASSEPPADIAAITSGMNDCDAQAAKDPNSLYFFVLPLLVAQGGSGEWRGLSEVGTTFLLLSGKDAIDGLRNGKLKVRPGRYTFAVLDSLSGQSFTWTSATSFTRLSKPVSPDMKMLKLGFDFSPSQSGTTSWSSEFRRDSGTCYWVSVLVRE